MIDFACKQFNLEEVIRCGLSISKTDINVLKYLLKTGKEEDSKKVSKELKIDLSTAQRSLKRLRERNLVKRRQKNLSSGGYNLLYSSIPSSEIKMMLENIVGNWTKKVKKELNNWEG